MVATAKRPVLLVAKEPCPRLPLDLRSRDAVCYPRPCPGFTFLQEDGFRRRDHV